MANPDDFDHPHLMYGQMHATVAALMAIIDTLPPSAGAAFASNLEPNAQFVRDLFGDQAFEDVYFEGFDTLIDRFRDRALRTNTSD